MWLCFWFLLSLLSSGKGALGWTESQQRPSRAIPHGAGLSADCTLLCGRPTAAPRGVNAVPLAALTLTLYQLNASGTVSIQEFRDLWKQLMLYQVRTKS